MNRLKIALLFFLTVLIDLSILPRIVIYGVSPMISLAVIVIISMKARSEKITYFAMILGFVMDIYFSNLLGLRALSYYLISYYVFKFAKKEGNTFSNGFPAFPIAVIANSIYLYVLKIVAYDNMTSLFSLGTLVKTVLLELVISFFTYLIAYFLIEKVIFRQKKKFFS